MKVTRNSYRRNHVTTLVLDPYSGHSSLPTAPATKLVHAFLVVCGSLYSPISRPVVIRSYLLSRLGGL